MSPHYNVLPDHVVYKHVTMTTLLWLRIPQNVSNDWKNMNNFAHHSPIDLRWGPSLYT